MIGMQYGHSVQDKANDEIMSGVGASKGVSQISLTQNLFT
jgi:hypothetical protein